MMDLEIVWVTRPSNRKTGEIPTGYIGTSRAEAWDSCEGCALRGNGCYAWAGTPLMGFASALRGRREVPYRYTIEGALSLRSKLARAIRFGALGDPSAASSKTLRKASKLARSAGLAVLGYTHHWRRVSKQTLRTMLMASCDNVAQADVAISQGWKPAAIVPQFSANPRGESTPLGARLLRCPAQKTKTVTCNDCRLCDPQNPYWEKQTSYVGIAFQDHGPKSLERKEKRAAARA
jgi:hypothetical protein